MGENEMIKPNSSFPVFIVENLDEAKSFYSSYFSFGVAFENEWVPPMSRKIDGRIKGLRV